MKVDKKNKIKEATVVELFQLYLEQEYDLIMSFEEYLENLRQHGVIIAEEKTYE